MGPIWAYPYGFAHKGPRWVPYSRRCYSLAVPNCIPKGAYLDQYPILLPDFGPDPLPLIPTFNISVAAHPGLCQIWSELQVVDFLVQRLISCFI